MVVNSQEEDSYLVHKVPVPSQDHQYTTPDKPISIETITQREKKQETKEKKLKNCRIQAKSSMKTIRIIRIISNCSSIFATITLHHTPYSVLSRVKANHPSLNFLEKTNSPTPYKAAISQTKIPTIHCH